MKQANGTVTNGLTISASTLRTFMACPLQAKRAKLEHLPQRQNAKASFGTIIHHVLESYNHDGDIEKAIATFLDLWENPEKLGVTPEWWPKFTSYGSLKTRGVEILRRLHESIKWDDREVLFTEHPFLVPLGRHHLKGVVDLGEIRKSGKGKTLLRIVDWKTAAKPPTRAELALDLQMTVYMYASLQPEFWVGNGVNYPPIPNGQMLYETYKDMPRRAIWWGLWNAKELDSGPRGKDDYERLNRLIDEVEKAIQHDVFIPRIGDACGLCSYTKECGLTIPTREEVLDDPNAWI